MKAIKCTTPQNTDFLRAHDLNCALLYANEAIELNPDFDADFELWYASPPSPTSLDDPRARVLQEHIFLGNIELALSSLTELENPFAVFYLRCLVLQMEPDYPRSFELFKNCIEAIEKETSEKTIAEMRGMLAASVYSSSDEVLAEYSRLFASSAELSEESIESMLAYYARTEQHEKLAWCSDWAKEELDRKLQSIQPEDDAWDEAEENYTDYPHSIVNILIVSLRRQRDEAGLLSLLTKNYLYAHHRFSIYQSLYEIYKLEKKSKKKNKVIELMREIILSNPELYQWEFDDVLKMLCENKRWEEAYDLRNKHMSFHWTTTNDIAYLLDTHMVQAGLYGSKKLHDGLEVEARELIASLRSEPDEYKSLAVHYLAMTLGDRGLWELAIRDIFHTPYELFTRYLAASRADWS